MNKLFSVLVVSVCATKKQPTWTVKLFRVIQW